MKNNYPFRGLFIVSSLALFTACQPVNNSQSSRTKNPIPVDNSQKVIVKKTVKNSDISLFTEIQKEASVKPFSTADVSTTNETKYSSVFDNLSENNNLVAVRKEMLIGLSKSGENIYKDVADRKERKRNGIKLPGEVSGIVEMAEYRRNSTMPIGTDKMLYEYGFLEKEYAKAINSPTLKAAKAAGYKTSRNSNYALPNVTWLERGPNNIPGRGRSIVVSPTNPNKWYNGTAGGGVWITDNAGLNWRTTTDYQIPNLATTTLAISASNANIIYAGTGEPFGNLDAITGSGIVKSLNAGENWTYLSNTTSFGSVGRLLISPTDANIIFAATSKGIYRSLDGGTNWTKTYSGSGTFTNVQDLKATADFSTIYATVNSYGVVKSTDGGTTWAQVFSAGTIKRIELAISPADNNTLFLSTESGTTTGLYLSSDAGATFVVQNYASGDSKEILGTQGWYDNVITAHPTNKNIAYVGGIYLAKVTVNPSTNTYSVLSIASGYDTKKLNTYVHPDQHGLVCQVDPNNPAQFRLLLNSDGGIYFTDYKTNPGETQNDWKIKASGLNNTQFYGADKMKGEDAYLAGAQDNGSSASRTIAPASATSEYLPLFGGDGFEVIWNYKDTQKLLFGSQYNNFVISRAGVQNTALYYARNIDNGSAKSPFYSKLANANNNPDAVFTVSSTGVWRSLDFGTSWTVSPFTPATNGTWFGNASYATVKVSVANPDVIWAVSVVSGGAGTTYKVNVSKDNGSTFNKTTGTFPTSGSYYATGLAASSVNAAQAYTLFSIAGQPKIVKTSDYGTTWTDITGFSPVSATGFPDVPVHSLLEMPFDSNVLWAGTDIGIFETTNGGANWYMVTDFPPVSVWNMKIVDDQVVLATHGRGVWTATIPQLSSYVLPVYVGPPTVKSTVQAGIHDMKAKAVFNYTDPQITDLKVYVDDTFVSTISGTTPNTDYMFTSSNLTEGNHTISVSGLYDSGSRETIKSIKNIEIINFNAGAANVNIPTFATADVYIGATGKFVIDNLSAKFSYSVLNNVGHPYANSNTYQTYLRTPIIIGSDSKQSITHMAFTEGGYDFAIVEASKDLINWVPVGKYDENSYADWANVSTAEAVTEAKFKTTDLNFPANFTIGEEVAVRLRLTTDGADTRFGWIVKSIVPSSSLGTIATDLQKEQISIAPNPATSNTDLYLPSTMKGNVSIGIYDASGKMVKTLSKTAAAKINLDVSVLEPGLYLILVKTESGNKALKLLKK